MGLGWRGHDQTGPRERTGGRRGGTAASKAGESGRGSSWSAAPPPPPRAPPSAPRPAHPTPVGAHLPRVCLQDRSSCQFHVGAALGCQQQAQKKTCSLNGPAKLPKYCGSVHDAARVTPKWPPPRTILRGLPWGHRGHCTFSAHLKLEDSALLSEGPASQGRRQDMEAREAVTTTLSKTRGLVGPGRAQWNLPHLTQPRKGVGRWEVQPCPQQARL